jgi:hypothetical protein
VVCKYCSMGVQFHSGAFFTRSCWSDSYRNEHWPFIKIIGDKIQPCWYEGTVTQTLTKVVRSQPWRAEKMRTGLVNSGVRLWVTTEVVRGNWSFGRPHLPDLSFLCLVWVYAGHTDVCTAVEGRAWELRHPRYTGSYMAAAKLRPGCTASCSRNLVYAKTVVFKVKVTSVK